MKSSNRNYRNIDAFGIEGDDLVVTFENGDRIAIAHVRLVPAGSTHVQWNKGSIFPSKTHLVIPARPHAFEVYWDELRALVDSAFAKEKVAAAARQAALIGQRIKELRESRKLSQAKVAEIAGMEQANVSRIENGHFDISTSTLFKLLAAMGYGPDALSQKPHRAGKQRTIGERNDE